MKITAIVGTFFYSLLCFVIGLSIISFVTHLVTFEEVTFMLDNLYNNLNARVIWGIVGFLLMLLNISFIQILLGKFHKEKNIAFVNPAGEVTISLGAIEGLIKRLTAEISEIKELRPDVKATKKGIIVSLRVVLWSDTNIPDTTSKLQDIVRSRIQEMLGIEETIVVKVHVVKIVHVAEESKLQKNKKEPETTYPFQAYR